MWLPPSGSDVGSTTTEERDRPDRRDRPAAWPTDRSTATLAAVDAVAVVAVLLYGELRHGYGPLSDPLRVAGTVGAFLLGWVVVTAVLGTYREAPDGAVASLRSVAGAWLGAANVGLLIRAAPAVVGGTTWPFPLVVTGTVLVGLLVGRSLVAALSG